MTPGATYACRVYVTDPPGTRTRQHPSPVIPGRHPGRRLGQRVRADGATHLAPSTRPPGTSWARTRAAPATTSAVEHRGHPPGRQQHHRRRRSRHPFQRRRHKRGILAPGRSWARRPSPSRPGPSSTSTASGKIIGFGDVSAADGQQRISRTISCTSKSSTRTFLWGQPVLHRRAAAPASCSTTSGAGVVGTLGADRARSSTWTASRWRRDLTEQGRRAPHRVLEGRRDNLQPARPTGPADLSSTPRSTRSRCTRTPERPAESPLTTPSGGVRPRPTWPPPQHSACTATFLSVAFDGAFVPSDTDGTVHQVRLDLRRRDLVDLGHADQGVRQGQNYTVGLTVTDDKGATASPPRTSPWQTEPPNSVPTACVHARAPPTVGERRRLGLQGHRRPGRLLGLELRRHADHSQRDGGARVHAPGERAGGPHGHRSDDGATATTARSTSP